MIPFYNFMDVPQPAPRSSLDRLLNEDSYNVNIATISKAAFVLGKRIELSLVDNNG